jgi:hypothetical protein
MTNSFGRRQNQCFQALSDYLLPRPPENRFGLGIPLEHGSGVIDLHKGIERGIDDAAQWVCDALDDMNGANGVILPGMGGGVLRDRFVPDVGGIAFIGADANSSSE